MECIFVDSAVLEEKSQSFLRNMGYYGARRAMPETKVADAFQASAEDVGAIMESVERVLVAQMGTTLMDRLNDRYKYFADTSHRLDFGQDLERILQKEYWKSCRVRFSHTRINLPHENQEIANRILDRFVCDSALYYKLSKADGVVPIETVQRAIAVGRKWIPGHETNIVLFRAPGAHRG